MLKRPLRSLACSIGSAPLLLAQPPQLPPPEVIESQDPDQAAEPKSRSDRDAGVRVVVTASGFAEQALETPYTFHVLSQSDYQANGFRTLPEGLRYTPGVMIQKTAHGHGSPYIRGFTGRQNLLLIDGIRVNNSTFRSGPVQYWNTIDPFSMDRLELIKSQGSVLFGSDAIGGTANVLTRYADFRGEASGQFFHHGTGLYRLDTNGVSHTGRLEGQVGEGGSWGLHVGLTYRDFGDIRDRSVGEMQNTGYEEFDYDLRADVGLGGTTTLTMAHQRVQQDDIWRTHRTVFFEPWEGTSLNNPDLAQVYDQDRTLSYLRLRDDEFGSAVRSYALTFSFQQQDEDFLRRRTAGANLRNQFDRTEVDTFGAALALESDIGPGNLVYGVDFYADRVDSTSREIRTNPSGTVVSDVTAVQGPVGDGARYNLFGAYAQYRFALAEDFEVTTGGRYTYASANIDTIDDGAGNPVSAKRNWNDTTFNLRGNYRLTQTLSIHAGASQAFRAPNLDDLSSLKSSRTDLISTGSLDVDPERYLTYEIGTYYRGERTAFGAAVYYTSIRDLIVSRPVGTVPGTGEIITASTNGANGYAYGFELEGEHRLDDEFTVSGFVAWVDGEADTFAGNSLTPERQPLSRLMPLTGSLALRWQATDNPLWLGARVTSAGRADRMNAGDRADTSRFPPQGTPSYVVVQLTSGYRVNDHLELFLTVDNATDVAYRAHGSGLNEAGLNCILGGKWSW